MCIVEKEDLRTPLKTSKHVVAFLDMLGASSRIEKDQDATLNEIYELYKSTIEIAEKNCSIGRLEGIKIKIFSDNIIIAKELPSDRYEREQDICNVLWWCSLFQNRAISNDFGWLLRGGITIGDFYIDKLMVWGKALLLAHELEKKVAKDPKIVIDDTIVPELRSSRRMIKLIVQDDDSKYFLHFMNMWPLIGSAAKDGFEKIKSGTLPLCDDGVCKKLRWHMNYVNKCLDDIEPESGQRLEWF